ncbi:MAG TPA: PQQ-binding-like beta-propeller repeat protein [Pirellulaceae bacterium]|nr:PQQ-binding-like beta-propeller repeat protein [Pirellulaceae bacterium]
MCLTAIGFCCATPSFSADWPQWRGPEGTGVSTDQGVPIVWHEQRSIVWKCPLPPWGASTPAIWGDAIFVTSHSAENKLLLLKLDRKEGRIAWTQEVGSGEAPRQAPKRTTQKFHELHNLASPSPVTDGKVVVAHFGNGDLAAYDFAGQQLWKRNLQDDHGVYSIWYGHANSPVIAGDVVISVCMQDSLAGLVERPLESYLVAHDLRSGAVRWKLTRATMADAEQCDAYTTPLLCQLNGVQQLVVMGGNQLDSYDPASGRRLWFLPDLVGGRTVTGPTISEGVIYATRGLRGALFAVRPRPAGELTSRDILWSTTEGTPDTCCPVVASGLVFTVSDDGIARCYLTTNGNLKWKERLKGKYKASPVAASGRIFFLNTEGLATVISASPRFDKLVENQLDDETIASPAISNGQIFLRGRKSLYCIGR